MLNDSERAAREAADGEYVAKQIDEVLNDGSGGKGCATGMVLFGLGLGLLGILAAGGEESSKYASPLFLLRTEDILPLLGMGAAITIIGLAMLTTSKQVGRTLDEVPAYDEVKSEADRRRGEVKLEEAKRQMNGGVVTVLWMFLIFLIIVLFFASGS